MANLLDHHCLSDPHDPAWITETHQLVPAWPHGEAMLELLAHGTVLLLANWHRGQFTLADVLNLPWHRETQLWTSPAGYLKPGACIRHPMYYGETLVLVSYHIVHTQRALRATVPIAHERAPWT